MAAELRALSDLAANADALEELFLALNVRKKSARRLALLGAAVAANHLPTFAPTLEADDDA